MEIVFSTVSSISLSALVNIGRMRPVLLKTGKSFIGALLFTALLGLLPGSQLFAESLPTVRVAVLQFGTVNWEMDVIRQHHLDEKYHFSLDVTPVAGKNASAVALQSGAVDLIYSDWVWVNRQRFNHRMFGFSPVSAATGGLYAQPQSAVSSVKDIQGARLGVAGGSVDKSWLLLQAYSKQVLGKDLLEVVEPVFAAPPLLNQLMYDGKLPLSLNFWHYGARLEARGFKPIISVDEMIRGLGIDHQVPMLGWVFAEPWRQQHSELLGNFLKASREARDILLASDAEWLRIRDLTRAEDDQIFMALKKGYRAGVQLQFGTDELNALEDLYAFMLREGGTELTGGADKLDRSLFWISNPEMGVKQVATGEEL
ncbi:NitT/TauT family transport system substrate-binding protein [Amphritea atlantica]|uniref:NitT/TauT family transport system substrate-binding protein n=1 Tax=Amphritea atlantica TaxID=355243 RepID=A0A1H9H4E6_9GAMM|nr:ABC transporter substrate-binding protein [Amphritea atlantica]SEQ57192.1 NitT/TauT family transport system substrate-binding protein [Amphritea atlantica]